MKRISLYQYIACKVPKKAFTLLKNNRYRNIPKNNNSIAHRLALFVKEDGEKALLEIAKIHPDKELILKAFEKPEIIKEENTNNFINAIGKLNDNTINILIISGAIVLTGSLITIIATSKT